MSEEGKKRFLEFCKDMPPFPTGLLAVSVDFLDHVGVYTSERVTPAPVKGSDVEQQTEEVRTQLLEEDSRKP
jgi:hypothetical protein